MRSKLLALLLLCPALVGCGLLENLDDTADGGVGADVQPGPQLASLETIEKFCLFLQTDQVSWYRSHGHSLSDCIDEVNRTQLPLGIGEVPPMGSALGGRFQLAHGLECARNSNDLASFNRCTTYDHVDFCKGKGSSFNYCDGDYLIYCSGNQTDVTDCAAGGATCYVKQSSNHAACVFPGEVCQAPTAPAVATGRSCSDAWITGCSAAGEPVEVRGLCRPGESCKDYGVIGGSNVAVCSAGESCSKERCDGNTLVQCDEVYSGDANPGNNAYRVDCTSIGMICQTSFNDSNCQYAATDCTQNHADACDGSGIKVCAAGKEITLACSSIGLSTCEQPAGYQPTCK